MYGLRIVSVISFDRFAKSTHSIARDDETASIAHHVDIVDVQVTVFRAGGKLGAVRREFTKPDLVGMFG